MESFIEEHSQLSVLIIISPAISQTSPIYFDRYQPAFQNNNKSADYHYIFFWVKKTFKRARETIHTSAFQIGEYIGASSGTRNRIENHDILAASIVSA